MFTANDVWIFVAELRRPERPPYPYRKAHIGYRISWLAVLFRVSSLELIKVTCFFWSGPLAKWFCIWPRAHIWLTCCKQGRVVGCTGRTSFSGRDRTSRSPYKKNRPRAISHTHLCLLLTWYVTLIVRPLTVAWNKSSSSPHLTRTDVPAGISSLVQSWLYKY